jgi:osmotically-inducible protein OsmY
MRAKRGAILTTALSVLAAPAVVSAQQAKQVMPPKAIHEQMAKHSQEVVGQLLKIATPQTPFDFINFYLSGPVVVLTGFTTKQTLKDEAEQQVSKLKWVDHVVNEIELVAMNNQTIRLRKHVLDILEQAAPQSFPESHAEIRIKVTEKFDITLVGVINKLNKGTFEAALVQIKNLPLVRTVTNHVLVSKG